MKNQFIKFSLLFLLIIFSSITYGQIYKGYLLVDHNAVQEFGNIPDKWLEQAKELTMHYGTASHGTQILSGLKYLEEQVDATKYSVAYFTFEPDPPRLPDQEFPPAIRISAQGSWPDDYWNGIEGMNQTRNAANTGYFNFSMYAFCGELSEATQEYVQAYLDSLNKLENEYPNMRFIYMTGHTDGNEAWSKLNDRNNEIRQYCIQNNKILYDFADIESHDPDGNYYSKVTDACEWCEDWCNNHPEDCVNLMDRCESGIPTCCPHSHGFNCVIKGRAFWWMMARLAGWNGTQSNTDTIPPGIPQNVKAIAKSDSEITINWNVVQDNIKVSGYYIYRDYVKIASSTDTNYTDSGLLPATLYTYQISAFDASGNESSKSDADTATTKKKTVKIDEDYINKDFYLFYNYPNPFNPTTNICFKLMTTMNVKIDIFTINGTHVSTLLNNKLNRGFHSVTWDGKNDQMQTMASGSYIYRITTDYFSVNRRMVLIK